MVDILRENDTYVSCLFSAIQGGQSGLADVPPLVVRVIRENRWQKRMTKLGPETCKHFEEFVQSPPLKGLGTSMDMLWRLCKEDKEALEAIDAVTKRPPALHNIQGTVSAPTGTSEKAAIRRLNKDRPDLLKQVKSGKLSAHAAMIQAGFRQKSLTVPADVAKAARALKRHFTGESLAALIRELSS